jgi:hypothetical protein
MQGNPFAGTKFETDWIDGFNAGMVAPRAKVSAPTPLMPGAQDAFNNGVATGQAISGLLELPVPVPEATSFDEFVQKATEIGHYSEPVLELKVITKDALDAWTSAEAAEAGTGAAKVGEVLVNAGLVFAFEVALAIAIWGPRRDPFFSASVSERLEQIVAQISTSGIAPTNLELFMAVCFLPKHQIASDVLSDTGCWHSRFRLTFKAAAEDGAEHKHHSDVRVLRFQTADPTIVEVLNLQ